MPKFIGLKDLIKIIIIGFFLFNFSFGEDIDYDKILPYSFGDNRRILGYEYKYNNIEKSAKIFKKVLQADASNLSELHKKTIYKYYANSILSYTTWLRLDIDKKYSELAYKYQKLKEFFNLTGNERYKLDLLFRKYDEIRTLKYTSAEHQNKYILETFYHKNSDGSFDYGLNDDFYLCIIEK